MTLYQHQTGRLTQLYKIRFNVLNYFRENLAIDHTLKYKIVCEVSVIVAYIVDTKVQQIIVECTFTKFGTFDALRATCVLDTY